MDDISAAQKQIVENFSLFEEWEDKYGYLLEFSDSVRPFDPSDKVAKNLVKGCQSRLWLIGELKEGAIWYSSDGDSPIPRGIAAVLVKVLSGHKPEAVIKADINFHKETGLVLYLSPARVNGIESMILKFKSLAAQYLIKH